MAERNVSEGDLREKVKGINLVSHGELLYTGKTCGVSHDKEAKKNISNNITKQVKTHCCTCIHEGEGDVYVRKVSRSLESRKSIRRENNLDSSISDPLFVRRFTPKEVIDALGQREFWKARKAILRQQKVFSLQVFELHQLIKIQQLMASSVHLPVIGDAECVALVNNNSNENVPAEAHGFVPEAPSTQGHPGFSSICNNQWAISKHLKSGTHAYKFQTDFANFSLLQAAANTASASSFHPVVSTAGSYGLPYPFMDPANVVRHEGWNRPSSPGLEASCVLAGQNVCIPTVSMMIANGGSYPSASIQTQKIEDNTFGVQTPCIHQTVGCSPSKAVLVSNYAHDEKMGTRGTLNCYEAAPTPIRVEEMENQGYFYYNGEDLGCCEAVNGLESERKTLLLFPLDPSFNLSSKKMEEPSSSGGHQQCKVIKTTPRAAVATSESAAVILSFIQRERQQSLSVK